jgi:hypothetical protein
MSTAATHFLSFLFGVHDGLKQAPPSAMQARPFFRFPTASKPMALQSSFFGRHLPLAKFK